VTHGLATAELASATLATMLEKRMLIETSKRGVELFEVVCHG
jgi:hypothetical protein